MAEGFLEATCRLTRSVCRLSIEVLSGTCGLIHYAFSLRSRIARDLAEAFLSLTAEIAGGARFSSMVVTPFGSEPATVE